VFESWKEKGSLDCKRYGVKGMVLLSKGLFRHIISNHKIIYRAGENLSQLK